MATFSTSHTCHMWRISDFSTSVMWRHLKFLHMWRNFQFPHNCHTWKAEIFPHDNFFSINNIIGISEKLLSERSYSYHLCWCLIDNCCCLNPNHQVANKEMLESLQHGGEKELKHTFYLSFFYTDKIFGE